MESLKSGGPEHAIIELTRADLQKLLEQSQKPLAAEELDRVQAHQRYYEEKCYKSYTAEGAELLEYAIKASPKYRNLLDKVESLAKEKESLVEDELDKEILRLESRTISKHQLQEQVRAKEEDELRRKADILRKRLVAGASGSHSDYEHSLESVNVKELEQKREEEILKFLQQKKKQKAQRKQKLQELRKKELEEQKAKQSEMKEQEKQQFQQRRHQMIEKSHKLQEQFASEKSKRLQHEEKYLKLIQQSENLLLYKKYDEELSEKLKKQQEQRLKKLEQRKQKLNLAPLDSSAFEEHSKRYQEYRQEQEQKRQQRMRLKNAQLQERAMRFYSSYKEQQKPPDPTPEELLQPLRERRRRIKQYYDNIKQKFKPKVDESKRKQLLNFIEQLHLGSKRLKKLKLDNGSVLYEQLPSNDHKMIGIRYLQYAKAMTQRSSVSRRKQQDLPSPAKPRKIDYLAQVNRKNRQNQKHNHSYSQDLEKGDYESRLKKVQHKSDVIDEEARRKEVLLKYGKFMTAQEILKCKEELDEHYLEVINMKLKLINEK